MTLSRLVALVCLSALLIALAVAAYVGYFDRRAAVRAERFCARVNVGDPLSAVLERARVEGVHPARIAVSTSSSGDLRFAEGTANGYSFFFGGWGIHDCVVDVAEDRVISKRAR